MMLDQWYATADSLQITPDMLPLPVSLFLAGPGELVLSNAIGLRLTGIGEAVDFDCDGGRLFEDILHGLATHLIVCHSTIGVLYRLYFRREIEVGPHSSVFLDIEQKVDWLAVNREFSR